MSIGCSSSCCTASFQRYTERHGARMLTHAARFFCTSTSASRSAAARSGRLVNTKSVLMRESFAYRGIGEPQAEHLLQARVVQSPRLAHEAQRLRRQQICDALARYARRARQVSVGGDQIEPIAHAQLAIVGGVIDAGRRIRLERARERRGQI